MSYLTPSIFSRCRSFNLIIQNLYKKTTNTTAVKNLRHMSSSFEGVISSEALSCKALVGKCDTHPVLANNFSAFPTKNVTVSVLQHQSRKITTFLRNMNYVHFNNGKDCDSSVTAHITSPRIAMSDSKLRTISYLSFTEPSFFKNTTSLHSTTKPPPPSKTALQQKRTMATKKHKRVVKMAKGYRGRSNNTFRAAIRRVEKAMQYAYRDRKVKKRNMRKLWIQRINAAVRQHGMSYSKFIDSMAKIGGGGRTTVDSFDGELDGDGDGDDWETVENNLEDEEQKEEKEKGIILNRKVLAELASNEPFSFKAVVDVVKMMDNEKQQQIK